MKELNFIIIATQVLTKNQTDSIQVYVPLISALSGVILSTILSFYISKGRNKKEARSILFCYFTRLPYDLNKRNGQSGSWGKQVRLKTNKRIVGRYNYLNIINYGENKIISLKVKIKFLTSNGEKTDKIYSIPIILHGETIFVPLSRVSVHNKNAILAYSVDYKTIENERFKLKNYRRKKYFLWGKTVFKYAIYGYFFKCVPWKWIDYRDSVHIPKMRRVDKKEDKKEDKN